MLPKPAKARQGAHHQHQPAVFFQASQVLRCSQNLPRPAKASSASAGCRFASFSGPRCSQNPPRPAKASISSISRLFFCRLLRPAVLPKPGQDPQHQPAVVPNPPRPAKASIISISRLSFFRLLSPAVLPKPGRGPQRHHQHQPAVVLQASQARSAPKTRQGPQRRASSASAGCLFSGFSVLRCSQNPAEARKGIISISRLFAASQARGAPKTRPRPAKASSASAGCRFAGFSGPRAKTSISSISRLSFCRLLRPAVLPKPAKARKGIISISRLSFCRLLRPAVLPKPAKARKGEHHQYQPAVFLQGCSQNRPRPAKASSASAGCRFAGFSGPRCSQNPQRPAKASIISISRLSFCRLLRHAVLPKPAKARKGEHHQHQPAVFLQASQARGAPKTRPRPAKASSASAGCRFAGFSGPRCSQNPCSQIPPRPAKGIISTSRPSFQASRANLR